MGQYYGVKTKFAERSLAKAGFEVLAKRSQLTCRKARGYQKREYGSHPEWKGTYANHGTEGRARMGSILGVNTKCAKRSLEEAQANFGVLAKRSQ